METNEKIERLLLAVHSALDVYKRQGLQCLGNGIVDAVFDSGCTDEEYSVNFAGRYRELHGVTVRTDTPEHFMDDLKKYGYITGCLLYTSRCV